MRLVSAEARGEATFGVLTDAGVATVTEEFRKKYADLRAVLAGDALPLIADNLEPPASGTRLLPPLPTPDKILCVGVNYRPHIEEMGREVPEYPVVFVRFPGSLVGHGQPLLRPRVSRRYDYEGELAIVIGRPARYVKREKALDFVAGYTCFMDGSVRDFQRHTMQFTAGKNFPQSGAMGPCLVTTDLVPEPSALQLTTRVNGAVRQEASLAELVFDIPALIEYCSTFTELLPGDVIATGTPGGVGAARTPPAWLEHGDRVEVEISDVGLLSNSVRDEAGAVAP